MQPLRQLLPILLLIFFAGCLRKPQKPYAIKDFRKSIQPFLNQIVQKGIVTYHDSSSMKSITDEEWARLADSEHPLLRATALMEMINRKSFEPIQVISGHLSDTAMVPVDNGEFGMGFSMVTDHLLFHSEFPTAELRDKIIEEVLTRHNYLRAAYTILDHLEPQEKYYPYIKDMASRPRRLDPYDGFEQGFGDIELAIYGLAQFRKKEDISLIKEKLMTHLWRITHLSFRMMEQYPDSAYFDILEKYHRQHFYQFLGIRPNGFTGFNADNAAPEDFISALVAQQNERSAKLLDTMLVNLKRNNCMPDKRNILAELIFEIWDHPCAAYDGLRKKISNSDAAILKRRVTTPLQMQEERLKLIRKTYTWYN